MVCAFECVCIQVCGWHTCCAVPRQDQHSGVAGGACVCMVCAFECVCFVRLNVCVFKCVGGIHAVLCPDKINTAEWLEVRVCVCFLCVCMCTCFVRSNVCIFKCVGAYVLCCDPTRSTQRSGWRCVCVQSVCVSVLALVWVACVLCRAVP